MYSKSIFQTTIGEKQYKNQFDLSRCASSLHDDPVISIPRIKSDFIPYAHIFQFMKLANEEDLECKSQGNVVDQVKNKKKKRRNFGFRKIQKKRNKNISDYKKNICGYITKKVIRQFVSVNYLDKVQFLCNFHNCDYIQTKNYYSSRVQRVTGPSHIPQLLIAQNNRQVKMKKVFKQFFQWFLKERYLRYLLNQGKMANKNAYIQYKNTSLISILQSQEMGVIAKQEEIQMQSPAVKIQQITLQPKFFSRIQIPIAIKPSLV